MKFVDSVKIQVRAGSGGAGCTSFRREKYVEFGGPDGGDGGHGGNVIFRGDTRKATLLDLSFQQHQHAENGQSGGGSNKHGRNGKDVVIHVPLGTVIYDQETDDLLLDVVEETDYLFLKGGRGGRGNARFKTSTNRAPEHHQPGETGAEMWLILELKLMADVGLVGFPNAGKSTLISKLSHARPKIADYPFTTLVPQLGVVKHSESETFVIADIPGIIEGAHEGRGLGDQFLRHIERTATLLIMLDGSGFSEAPPLEEYEVLLHELASFASELLDKPRAVALTKMDSVSDWEEIKRVEEALQARGETVFRISSLSGSGLKELQDHLAVTIRQARHPDEAADPSHES
jgi:GTP-binding protein